MKIRVKFLAYFRDLFGAKEISVDLPPGALLRDLLERLGDLPERRKAILTEKGEIHSQVVVMKNGAPAQSAGGMKAPLADGDTVAVFPFLGGG